MASKALYQKSTKINVLIRSFYVTAEYEINCGDKQFPFIKQNYFEENR